MHWTQRTKARTSLYRQTAGNPHLRAIAIESLFRDKERIEHDGKKGSGYDKFVSAELTALGVGDYIPGFDDGEAPKGEI